MVPRLARLSEARVVGPTAVAGTRHVFDSFECAIHAIAPRREHCGGVVVGHGVEAEGHFFCCVHRAREGL